MRPPQIVRAFVRLKAYLTSHKEISESLSKLEEKVDKQFALVFKVFDELMKPVEKTERKRIGYKIGKTD